MTKPAAKTAEGPAEIVALEQLFPKGTRLLDDDLILRIVPRSLRFWAWLCSPAWMRNTMFRMYEKLVPGAWALFPCRKHFIEDKAQDAVHGGVKAVVNLGAGLDTLVYRSLALQELPAWEVDQAVNIATKRAGLVRALGAVPERVTQVAIDFDHEDLSETLAAHGYRRDVPTLFVLEAVSQYLTQAGIHTTFDFLAGAPAGSRLVFTYIKRSFLEGRELGEQKLLYKQTVQKKLWLFGLDPDEVPNFLARYGWHVIEHLDGAEVAARYIHGTGRTIRSMAIEPVVYAEKR